MKLKTLLGGILISATALTACTDDKEVQQLATTLTAALAQSDTAAIGQIYPEAFRADSLATGLKTEAMKVEGEDGKYTVSLGNGKSLTVQKAADGSMSVTDSYGLFVWPEEKLAFAKATGWINSKMSDLEIARRFEDNEFEAQVYRTALAQFKENITATGQCVDGDWVITVKNGNNHDIPGSLYTVSCKWYMNYDLGDGDVVKDLEESTLLHGTGIKKNSVASIRTGDDTMAASWCHLQCTVNVSLSEQEFKEHYFKPTGKEYQTYLKSNK